MTRGSWSYPFPETARVLIRVFEGARILRIREQGLQKLIEQGRLDGFYLPTSTRLYVDRQQVEALSSALSPRFSPRLTGGAPPISSEVAAPEQVQHPMQQLDEKVRAAADALRRVTDLEARLISGTEAFEASQREITALKELLSAVESERDELTQALSEARGAHDQLRSANEMAHLEEAPAVAAGLEDLTARLEEAIEARREAQERLRKGEEELAALAEQGEAERVRWSDEMAAVLRDKEALEDRVRVLETAAENRDESSARHSEALADELRAALREKEKVKSELLRLRLRVKHFAEVEDSRDAALARLEHEMLESETLEAEVARLRARLDGLLDAESERDRLRLELDEAINERESTRESVVKLQVMAERIEAGEAERTELLTKLEQMSQTEADRNHLAAQLETAQLERRVFDAEVHRVRCQTILLEEELKRYKNQEKRTARRRR